MKIRMRVARQYRENDPDGEPTRKTVGLELASGSDENDENATIKASSVALDLHGVHEAGWSPFEEGGDFIVTIERAPSLIRGKEEKPAKKKNDEK